MPDAGDSTTTFNSFNYYYYYSSSSALFVDLSRFGLRIRNLETLWKQQQIIKLSLLRSSDDHRCQDVLELICQRQGSLTKKFAPAVVSPFAQTVAEANIDPPAAQMLCPERTEWCEPPVRQPTQSVRWQANKYIRDLDVGSQLEHLRSLQVQGRGPQNRPFA